LGDRNKQFASFDDNEYLQFHETNSNHSTLILMLKGVDEFSLYEIRLLHKIIYQINGGIIVIEIG
jgi:hypothetical protein